MGDKVKAAELTGEWWAERLQQGDKKKFAAEVSRRVLLQLLSMGHCSLNCDYDPWGDLLKAVRAIGIDCSGHMFSAKGILPQKHSTLTTESVIKPKEGYGNWTEDILVK